MAPWTTQVWTSQVLIRSLALVTHLWLVVSESRTALWRASCKVIHRFLTAWRVSTLNPTLFKGQMCVHITYIPALWVYGVISPGSGRSPGGGNPLQCSCRKNTIDRGPWQATVHEIAESDMTKWLTLLTFTFFQHIWNVYNSFRKLKAYLNFKSSQCSLRTDVYK